MSSTSDSEPSPAVIAACAAVGGLILIFLIVKIGLCIHRRRKRKAVPLPPVRPLAATHTLPWSTTGSANASVSKYVLSSPSVSPSTYHPDFLIAQRKNDARNVYRQYSGSTLNTTEEMPLRQPPSPISPSSAPLSPDTQLVPPQPSFFGLSPAGSVRSSAQVSISSSTEESDIASYPPQQHHQSLTAFPTTADSEDPSASRPSSSTDIAPLRVDHSPSMPFAHNRHVSMAGSVSSMQTTRSVQTTRSMRSTRTASTVRGPPHKSYSRVEVVLPTPLAPQNDPHYGGISEGASYYAGGNSRNSACDPWLRVGRQSTSGAPFVSAGQSTQERERRSRTVSSEMQPAPRPRPFRPSLSSELSYATSVNSYSSTPFMSRSSSVSSSAHSNVLRQKPSLDMSNLPPIPPVPRVPSMYTNSTASSRSSSPKLALSDSVTGNGSLRGLASDSTIRNKALSGSASGSALRPKPEPESESEPTRALGDMEAGESISRTGIQ